uniref:Uncharacterized protein n=1 Tax=Arion vulgaris TaxID=1028688 RepID=A0A0B7A9G3_9EUPU
MEQLKHKAKEALVLSALSKENGSAATETAVTDNSEDLGDNTEQKASDIAHLVRKKRKPDSDLLDTDIPLDIKKLRPDGDYDASLKQETEVNGTQLNTNVGGEDCCLKQNEDEAMSAAEPVAS